ncbi:elongation factor P maturation arginine rhamnosyltransferase EarP [Alysiella crassa]|uniref:Protein-arginine rhamnosyltransferase n=1 Tax=Alysiella crassa TaxID=153491 RepID=A0A376BMX5_9NEIS|nr:elongation factor P maturation arginine rhamnosyltransferase EarP [Alysiella crassa]SSY70975.1 Uncharacterized protein conserved in bacteria [Alysiella crassa]
MNTICYLFCNVIDNFGDIGVSWRLARELRTRLDWQVFLFVDDDVALKWIAPEFASEKNILIKQWVENKSADLDGVPPPNVVIETFACRLPENVLTKMKQNQAVWLNWEYLSAEDWAVRTHGMQSLQADGFAKYFWQMGFVAASGGLIREQNLLDKSLSKNHYSVSGSLKVLLFGYESAAWVDVLAAWQQLGWQMEIDVVGVQVIESLKKFGYLPAIAFTENQREWFSGSLKIRQIDFVPQADFDDLLAQYDWLFVRGEDSFVRAQFAGKPFFWHIYPQDERAHLEKLDAFWQLAFGENGAAWQVAHRALSGELNGGCRLPEQVRLAHWQTLREQSAAWQNWVLRWQESLFNQTDTVTRLANWLAQSVK